MQKFGLRSAGSGSSTRSKSVGKVLPEPKNSLKGMAIMGMVSSSVSCSACVTSTTACPSSSLAT